MVWVHHYNYRCEKVASRHRIKYSGLGFTEKLP